MPPSPALRCSPGREFRSEHNHKRGRSFESTVPMKTKDDDLTLFTDMESRERDNFLLQTADDLNDSIARLRYYSDLKLNVNIQARGESSDLLNVDGEKNDYDWLLTPPDTPLFRALDDEEAQPVNPAPRGRQHSQPISIRSSASEKTQRTSRSSYSPHRLSSSPRSATGVTQPKVTPSSAPYSSPTPLRPMTPSRRPSTPPNKPSATTPRSSTPTLRRMSTGSSAQAFSPVRRGTSPVRPSRGNSASPKLQGWLTNPPGFSSDSPANLCTSLAELPSSNSKAMSPASRNGRQSMSPTAPRNRRQLMSPVASRSTTSLHSHERDRFSTYSKGSVVSSGDDDVDSLYSLGIETSSSPTSGKNGIIGNSRAIPFSKKPVRTPSASSIPKRSFDSALRQVDHRKTPQNMFRPLVSSVPTTTFYTGKANSVHRPLFSRNSSVTTSSNASSELGAIVAHDFIEAEDHDQNHLANEWEKPQDFDAQEEIFIFDKMDEISENGHSVGGVTNKIDLEELEKSAANFRDPGSMAPGPDASYLASIPPEVDCLEMLKTCFKCGKQYRVMNVESITDVCQECVDDDLASSEVASQSAFLVAQNEYPQSVRHTGIDRLSEEMQPAMEISELPGLHENDVDRDPDCVPSSSFCGMEVDLTEKGYSDQQPKSCQEVKAVQSESKFQEPQDATLPSPRASTLEGTGISVLLQRSSSSKWPVVQGRSFLASSIMCSEPSYMRDNANVLRRSFSRDSASPSSSVDLASSRQLEFRVQRQLSSRKAEIEHMRNDDNAKAQITGSLNSGLSSEQTFNCSVDAVDFEPLGKKETFKHKHNNSMENMRSSSTKSMAITLAVVEGDLFSCADSCAPVDSLHDAESSLAGVSEELGHGGRARDSGVEHGIPETSCIGEEDMLNHSACGNEMSDVATESSSLAKPLSQISLEGVQDLPSDFTASSNPHNMDVSHECSGPAILEKDSPASALESNTIDQHHEKSMITVEGPRGHISRSLTLEEATDTILFCSSIIHDLAYKAATEVMEREEPVTEPLRPTIPSNRNTVSDQKDSWTSSYKRTPKPQKTKQKRLDTETNTTFTELRDNTKIQNTMASNPDSVANKVDSAKPPKLESKCNCTIM